MGHFSVGLDEPNAHRHRDHPQQNGPRHASRVAQHGRGFLDPVRAVVAIVRQAPGRPPPADPPAGGGAPSRRNAVLRAVGLIAVVVAWLAIAGLGGPAIGSLSSVQSNDQESFLPSAAESVQAANAAARGSTNPASCPPS